MTKNRAYSARIPLLDSLKGILILLVLLGHAIQYGSGTVFRLEQGYYTQPLFCLIYSFHMPFFMGIAGFLSYSSLQKRGCWEYILNRWKQLFLPIVTWSVLITIVHYITTSDGGLVSLLLFCLKQIASIFWFLRALLIACTLVALVETYLHPHQTIGYVFIISVLLLLPGGGDMCKFMFPCFLLGFYVKKQQFYRYFQSRFIFLASLLGWIILLPYFSPKMYIYNTGFSLFNSAYPVYEMIYINLFRYLIAILASVCVTHIIQKIQNRFFEYCGKRSLAIYILSTYLFIDFLTVITKDANPSLLLNLLGSVLILVLCLIGYYLLKLNCYLSKFLLGE